MPDIVTRSRILGTGLGIPSKVLTNFDLEKIVDTNDEWIRTRTGIRERRFIDRDQGETLSSISIQGAREALARSKILAEEIDLVLCCTATPDTIMPITAARVAGQLGCLKAAVMDVNAACSGFITGLHMADGLIRSHFHKKVLVIGGDVFSAILDWTDRTTCVLFGDGSGAAVVGAFECADPKNDSMIVASKLYHLFDADECLAVKGGGSRTPINSPRYNKEEKPYITMQGQEVFKAGSRAMAQAGREVMEMCGVTVDDVDWLVPHQANIRIIEMVGKLLEFPAEKTYVNVDRWGNSSAGTVPICLAEMEQKGMLKKGQLVLLDVFGGGYTYGAVLVRW